MIRTPLTSIITALLLWSAAASSHADLPANIMLDNGSVSSGATLINVDGDNIVLSEKGRNVKIALPKNKIQEIEFVYEEAVVAAVTAAEEGKWQEAADGLKPQVEEMLPYLIIPRTNIAVVLDTYTQALYELGNLDEFEKVYARTTNAGNEELAQSSKAWLGYLRARKGETAKMEEIFKALGELDSSSQAFALREIAYCYFELEKQNYRKASDHVSKVVASGSLESRIYPEAMFLSAKCYDGLAEKQQEILTQQRQEKLEQAMQAERVVVARKLQQAAREANKAQPTEQEILDAVDKQKVEDEVGSVPPVTESQYYQAAQRVYLLIELFYPNSEWGRDATEVIADATRKKVIEKQWTASLAEITTEESPAPTEEPAAETEAEQQ